LYSNYSNYVSRAIINNNHLFNISLMLHLDLINNKEQELLTESKVPLFLWEQSTFNVQDAKPNGQLDNDWKDYKAIENKIEIIIKKSYRKLDKYLKNSNHKTHKNLLTLEVFKLLLFKNLNNLNDDLINEVSHIYNFYIKSTLKLPSL